MANEMGEATLTVKVELDEQSLDEAVRKLEERLGSLNFTLTVRQKYRRVRPTLWH